MRRPIPALPCSSRNKLKCAKAPCLREVSHTLVHFGEKEWHRNRSSDACTFSCFILRRKSSDPRPAKFADFHTKGRTGLRETSPQRSDPGPRWALSVGVGRIDILGQSLPIVTLFAESLPVALVPEQFLVTTVRNDVIHHGCPDVLALLGALHTQRMGFEIRFSRFLPSSVVSTLGSRPCCFRVERQVLLTVEPTGFHQFWTARVVARCLWSVRHLYQLLKNIFSNRCIFGDF